MATPAPITIPTKPIGSIPRPTDLIERVAKADSEDPAKKPLNRADSDHDNCEPDQRFAWDRILERAQL
jgi:hypothetical protein